MTNLHHHTQTWKHYSHIITSSHIISISSSAQLGYSKAISKTAIMAKPRPSSKRTSKADTIVTNDLVTRKASTGSADNPEITLPSLAQDYLQNKDEVMELLLKLTKALKEEREARHTMEREFAELKTQQTQMRQTVNQQASQLPETVRMNINRDIEDMLDDRDDQFANIGVYEDIGELGRQMHSLEEQFRDLKREQPGQLENDETLVEEGGPRRVPDRVEVDLISDPFDVDMSDVLMKPL